MLIFKPPLNSLLDSSNMDLTTMPYPNTNLSALNMKNMSNPIYRLTTIPDSSVLGLEVMPSSHYLGLTPN
jgi:hypothetical protein